MKEIHSLTNIREVINYLDYTLRENVDVDAISKIMIERLLSGNPDDIKSFSDHLVFLPSNFVSRVFKRLDRDVIMKINLQLQQKLKPFQDNNVRSSLTKMMLSVTKDPEAFNTWDLIGMITPLFNRATLHEYVEQEKMAYHVSSLSLSSVLDTDGEPVRSFTLKSSLTGAMEPGVYTSPYPNLVYTGGDQDNKEMKTCLIFAYKPTNDHLLYGVAQDYFMDNIEISSRGENIVFDYVEVKPLDREDLQEIGAKALDSHANVDYHLVTSKRNQSEISLPDLSKLSI